MLNSDNVLNNLRLTLWTLARNKYKTNSIAVHFIVMGLLRVLSLACICQTYALVNGHGNIVKPMAWWDENQAGWHWDEDGIDTGLGCGVLDMPTNTEFHDETGKDPDCKQYWLSHNAEIPGGRPPSRRRCRSPRSPASIRPDTVTTPGRPSPGRLQGCDSTDKTNLWQVLGQKFGQDLCKLNLFTVTFTGFSGKL